MQKSVIHDSSGAKFNATEELRDAEFDDLEFSDAKFSKAELFNDAKFSGFLRGSNCMQNIDIRIKLFHNEAFLCLLYLCRTVYRFWMRSRMEF